jgi:hypothetical protein
MMSVRKEAASRPAHRRALWFVDGAALLILLVSAIAFRSQKLEIPPRDDSMPKKDRTTTGQGIALRMAGLPGDLPSLRRTAASEPFR